MKKTNLGDQIKQMTRELRKRQTESESILWQLIRNRQLNGKKFLRQYPVAFYWKEKKRFFIADFYCHEAKLIIELDGSVHLKQKSYDEHRDYILSSLGMKVIRISNDKIMNNINSVIELLKNELVKT